MSSSEYHYVNFFLISDIAMFRIRWSVEISAPILFNPIYLYTCKSTFRKVDRALKRRWIVRLRRQEDATATRGDRISLRHNEKSYAFFPDVNWDTRKIYGPRWWRLRYSHWWYERRCGMIGCDRGDVGW